MTHRNLPILLGPAVRRIVFTIHDRPADYPGWVVVTADEIVNPVRPGTCRRLPIAWLYHSAEEARRAIRDAKPEAILFPRDPTDGPAIVESWF